MVDLVNLGNDNNITNNGIHPSFVSNNFSNILDEKRAASSFKIPTKSTITPNNNQQNKTQTELHSYTPSIFDTPKEVWRAFDVGVTKKITDFQEKYRDADGKAMRAIIDFSTNDISRNKTIDGWINSANSASSKTKEYVGAAINEPTKLPKDIGNISLEASQNLGDNIKKKREAYYEAKQYGGVPTFIGQTTSDSPELFIGAAAIISPVAWVKKSIKKLTTLNTDSDSVTKLQNLRNQKQEDFTKEKDRLSTWDHKLEINKKILDDVKKDVEQGKGSVSEQEYTAKLNDYFNENDQYKNAKDNLIKQGRDYHKTNEELKTALAEKKSNTSETTPSVNNKQTTDDDYVDAAIYVGGSALVVGAIAKGSSEMYSARDNNESNASNAKYSNTKPLELNSTITRD